MALHPQIKQMIEQDIDDLIVKIMKILEMMDTRMHIVFDTGVDPANRNSVMYTEIPTAIEVGFYKVQSEFIGFMASLPHLDYFKVMIESANKLEFSRVSARKLWGYMQALKEFNQKGRLDTLINRIEISVASDYMSQAEALMTTGMNGQHDHIAATVLTGTVLEKELHDLCLRQTPPIPLNKNNGDHKSVSHLIQDLHATKVIDKADFDLLNYCTKIRNYAAHGDYAKLTKPEVQIMIQSVQKFLATL